MEKNIQELQKLRSDLYWHLHQIEQHLKIDDINETNPAAFKNVITHIQQAWEKIQANLPAPTTSK